MSNPEYLSTRHPAILIVTKCFHFWMINTPSREGFDPPIARTYSSTECENSALTIQATTAGFSATYFHKFHKGFLSSDLLKHFQSTTCFFWSNYLLLWKYSISKLQFWGFFSHNHFPESSQHFWRINRVQVLLSIF